jgi:energy-coupling factor transporter ATP-binding protein EcfA2
VFAANEERLTLIYGANGTGKTTLLRMLFDGLSSAHDRGHRNALAQIRFQSFVIQFLNGDVIEYARPDASAGPFKASVDRSGDRSSWAYHPDEPTSYELDSRTREPRPARPHSDEAAFLTALANLQVNPVFLTDTRVLTSDLVQADGDDERYYYRARMPSGAYVDQLVQRERDTDLRDALSRVHDYLRRVVFTGTQLGSERADTVYASVAEAIVTAPSPTGRPPKSTIPDLQTRVQELERRIADFTRYSLIPAIRASRLLAALRRAEPKQG